MLGSRKFVVQTWKTYCHEYEWLYKEKKKKEKEETRYSWFVSNIDDRGVFVESASSMMSSKNRW